jgi:hypothetical protein
MSSIAEKMTNKAFHDEILRLGSQPVNLLRLTLNGRNSRATCRSTGRSTANCRSADFTLPQMETRPGLTRASFFPQQ